MRPIYLSSLCRRLANCDCLLDFALLKIVLPGVFIFTDQVSNRDRFGKTVSQELILLDIELNTSQKFVIFEVLAIDNLAWNLADYRYVCGIHKANVEQRHSESWWHLTLNWLVTLLFEVIYLSYVFTLQDKCSGNSLAIVFLVSLVLAVAEYVIVHPSEASNLVLIVEKLQSKRISHWSLSTWHGATWLRYRISWFWLLFRSFG